MGFTFNSETFLCIQSMCKAIFMIECIIILYTDNTDNTALTTYSNHQYIYACIMTDLLSVEEEIVQAYILPLMSPIHAHTE